MDSTFINEVTPNLNRERWSSIEGYATDKSKKLINKIISGFPHCDVSMAFTVNFEGENFRNLELPVPGEAFRSLSISKFLVLEFNNSLSLYFTVVKYMT